MLPLINLGLQLRQPPKTQTTTQDTDNRPRHRQSPNTQTTAQDTDTNPSHRQPPKTQATDNRPRPKRPPKTQTTAQHKPGWRPTRRPHHEWCPRQAACLAVARVELHGMLCCSWQRAAAQYSGKTKAWSLGFRSKCSNPFPLES